MRPPPAFSRSILLSAVFAVATAPAQTAPAQTAPDTADPAPSAPAAADQDANPPAAPATEAGALAPRKASAPVAPAPAPRTRRVHHFGAAAGFVSGYGLSYRHWSRDSRTGYQVTAIPVAHIDEDETYLNLSVGALRMHSLHESRLTNFFAYYGAHYLGYHREWYGDDHSYSSRDDEDGHFLIAGGGTGMEVLLWDRSIILSLMFGYAANNNWEKLVDYSYDSNSSSRRYERDWQWSFTMHPTIEAAIFYGF